MKIEQERAELLPCLFCGSRNVAQRFTREASFEALSFVECYDCGARGSGVSGHGGEAIEEWNQRAALQSQDAEDAGMAEIVREAAQIIAAIPPEHAPDNIRWPIVDELEGFASKIDRARRGGGEGE